MNQSDSPENVPCLRCDDSLKYVEEPVSRMSQAGGVVAERLPLKEDVFGYSPISLLAIASTGLGMFCILGIVFPWLALFAVPGVILGFVALKSIRRYELSGQKLARLGICLSLIFGILTPIWYQIQFCSETLPGYQRVNFAAIMQDRENTEQKLAGLVGEHICLKGYALPRRELQLDEFQMDYERHGSSFGWKPDPEKTLMVQLPEGKSWKWHYDPIAVSGTLVRNLDAESNFDVPRFKLVQSAVSKAFVFP